MSVLFETAKAVALAPRRWQLAALLAGILLAGAAARADAMPITKSAMKARSLLVTGDRCTTHARDEMPGDVVDLFHLARCEHFDVDRCRITIPYRDRGKCHAEYLVVGLVTGRRIHCLRTLRWIVKGDELRQRKSRWWDCIDLSDTNG